MNCSADERAPVKNTVPKEHSSFATNRWFLALLASFSGVTLIGFVLHAWHARHPPQPETIQAPAAALRPRGEARPPDPVAEFLKCNPSVAQPQYVVFSGKKIVPTLEGPWCNSEQAAVVRGLLDELKYEYQAVVPRPYIYPSRVLEALLAMEPQKLRATLESFERQASKMGKLGPLVKFFAWGLPVHAQDLWMSLGGDDIIEAFLRCNLLTKCGSHSPMYTSAVQLFPIQHTPIVVATDWAHQSSKVRGAEPPVEAVDLHTLFLAHNTPVATGLRVLELGASGSGALGLVAASRGAQAVAVLDPSARGSRFARFNAWLNLMGNTVEVIRRPWQDAPTIFRPGFYLMLMHAVGPAQKKEAAIKSLLQMSKHMLSSAGSFVLGFEGLRCSSFTQDFNDQFCGDGREQGDLTGTAVCRRPNDSRDPEASQEGIVYGWRSLREDAPTRRGHCGHFTTVHTPSLDSAEGPDACSYTRLGMTCPYPDDPNTG